jgi:tRNA pseudouridine38-40 synthase
MPRYRLTIEYDGTGLVGWQRQDDLPSVQGLLEKALQKFCGETVTVYGAGRTDAGVHALGQVAHVDLRRDWPPERVVKAVNFHLTGTTVAVLDCVLAPADFHARFSATGRHYRYRIINRQARLTLDRQRAWLVYAPLDAEVMQQAAQVLVGRHDFTSFRAAQCQSKSPLKTLDRLTVERAGDEVWIHAAARSFLHNQVRAMVGSLVLVGRGRWRVADLRRALEARDRQAAGPNAPPCGLYLVGVDY